MSRSVTPVLLSRAKILKALFGQSCNVMNCLQCHVLKGPAEFSQSCYDMKGSVESVGFSLVLPVVDSMGELSREWTGLDVPVKYGPNWYGPVGLSHVKPVVVSLNKLCQAKFRLVRPVVLILFRMFAVGRVWASYASLVGLSRSWPRLVMSRYVEPVMACRTKSGSVRFGFDSPVEL